MKKLLYLALAVLIIAPLSTSAATFKSGDTVTISDGLEDDLYAAGQSVSLHADLAGDLFSAGNNIVLTGAILQDAFVSGGTVTIGNVGDDARVVGGTITFNGEVADDVFVAGGSLLFVKDSIVQGDLHGTGGMITLNGTVNGATKIGGGSVRLDGTLAGPTRIEAERIVVNGRLEGDVELSATTIEIGDDAQIAGAVRYWQTNGELNADTALVEGGSLTFDQSLESRAAAASSPIWPSPFFMLMMLLSAALVILVLVLADKRSMFENGARTLSAKYWKSLLAGLIFLIVTPVIGILLMVTVIGLPIGLFILVMYGFIVYFLPMIAALVVARWIDLRRTKQFNKWIIYLIALGAFVVLSLVTYIPYVGMLAFLLVYPATLGALMLNRRAKASRQT
ncbi:MAG: polymer-forming cytoskeletal protein [bacterium]|nr:polymer-forming cytoskeletal protein [bacterium]